MVRYIHDHLVHILEGHNLGTPIFKGTSLAVNEKYEVALLYRSESQLPNGVSPLEFIPVFQASF
jgi:hypothetical protein